MKTTLSYTDTREILEKYGFPVPQGAAAKTKDEAAEAASRIGFPVILLLPTSDISKARVVNSQDEVREEYQQILNSKGQNPEAIIQGHMEHGMEAILGMTRDPGLGPVLRFGLSGVFAFLNDTSSRVAPVSKEDAFEMIKENGAYEIIKGADEKKRDVGAIADVIEKLSRLSMENENVAEIEINPLFVYEKGVAVVNARVEVG